MNKNKKLSVRCTIVRREHPIKSCWRGTAAENRILKSQLNGRLKLSDAERPMLGKIGHRLGRQANWHQLGSPIAPVMTKEHARANRSDDFANGQMIQSPSRILLAEPDVRGSWLVMSTT